MSRWGRGRGGSVAVPLDSALFRENSNCPSAARSAGTVGKWGITSFTSIRSAPYVYGSSVVKKSVQDQNSPLTVPAVDTEQPPPKPKKFFKSRNAETFPPVPQIAYAPKIAAPPLSPEHPTNSKEKKPTKRSRYNRDSSSPELPRRNSEKTKSKKNAVTTKAAKKEEPSSENSQPPNKRYLVRNRNKVINYAEDGSNSPIPDMTTHYESLPPKVASPKASPLISSPVPIKADVSPSTSKDSAEERKPPPIVLRISKGTSRIVSTDSNEGFTSPGSDRHSSMDIHSDLDHKKSPSMETICSPKHEGLKITIKCSTLTQESKKEKKKDKKEGHHKSHKRHHKNDDETSRKASSPIPGTDTYDLYRTLASPVHENEKEPRGKSLVDNIESQLAKLDSTTSTNKAKSESKGSKPEPKPPESNSGRSRRNRPNINYSENDDYLDAITSKPLNKHGTKTVSDIKKEVRKSKRKLDIVPTPDAMEVNEVHSGTEKDNESHLENNDLLNVLSSDNDKPKTISDLQKTKTISDSQKTKNGKKQRNKIKNTNAIDNAEPHLENKLPEQSDNNEVELLNAPEDNIQNNQDEERSDPNKAVIQEEQQVESQPEAEMEAQNEMSSDQSENVIESQATPEVLDTNNDVVHTESIQAYSSDSAYNSCPNENSEEVENLDSQKVQLEENFKAPEVVNDLPSESVPVEPSIEDKPSVKLVITKKKGSIFKSKSLVNDNPSPLPARKRRHLYKHQWANDKGNETPRPEQPENMEVENPASVVPEELSRVTRYRSPDKFLADLDSLESCRQPYTSVRCPKEAKEFYTVVRNVKKAHQIQEIGEFQEFNDDVEYLLDTLQDNNPMSTRCLSAITLASKCTVPGFRMHLRAHGTVQKFFTALHDATNDQSLGLCTATVMFVLSQDRLNMDLDRESLELMLNLLESDASHKNALDDCGLTSAQLAKTQERVRDLCAEIKSQGKATHLDLENITVGHLAMETLLSLTSKRAGEWFKEELRILGGVDHIVRTIQDCASRLETPANMWTTAEVDVIRKADRCMRVLENVTQQNEDNQVYLVGEPLGGARILAALLRHCICRARAQPALRGPLLDAALAALKVLVNLSHCFGSAASMGAQVVGEQPSIMEICLIMLNNQANFIPDNKNFEFSVCILLLLINLVQNNENNTERFLSASIPLDNSDEVRSISALDLIVDLFYKRHDLARRAEETTDALLDGKKENDDETDAKKQSSQDDIDETVAKLLARAGAHMEHTMVCAYMALVLGHAACCAQRHALTVRERVPSYEPLLPTLRKYYNFLSLTASAEAAIVAHVKTTQRIIEFMEASDKENTPVEPVTQPTNTYSAKTYSNNYYQTSPSDVPQDMSLSNLNYSMNCSSSSSDRMSSSMEVDGYH